MKWFLLVLFSWLLVNQARAGDYWYSPSIPREFPDGTSEVCFLVERDGKRLHVDYYRMGEADTGDEGWTRVPERPLKWWEKFEVHGR